MRSRLLVLWALSLAASLAVGLLLLQLYQVSSSAETRRAEASLRQGCDAIGDGYGYFAAGWAGPPPGAPNGGVDAALRRDLGEVAVQALSPFGGVQGGMWQPDAGLIASPAQAAGAEPWKAALIALTARAGQEEQSESQAIASGATTVLLRACPLNGPIDGLVGWTLARVAAAPGYGELRLGVGVLLGLVLLSSLWLTVMIATYARRIGAIEAALAGYEGGGDLPQLAPTGERDLDRIVAALNRAGASLAQARGRALALSARVAQAERLAALGRVAAGMAHEIRNPIAAMRLRAENALAAETDGGPTRARTALQAILAQVARLDRLIAELLEMTRTREPAPVATDLAALLRGCAVEMDESGLRVTVECPELTLMLDAALLRRALDNLVQNALRHASPGGVVRIVARAAGERLLIEVRDDGAGVPEALREQVFEPFVTGHADGTGLGLAIAREMAQAQGGSLALTSPAGPTVFTLDLPLVPEGGAWPVS